MWAFPFSVNVCFHHAGPLCTINLFHFFPIMFHSTHLKGLGCCTSWQTKISHKLGEQRKTTLLVPHPFTAVKLPAEVCWLCLKELWNQSGISFCACLLGDQKTREQDEISFSLQKKKKSHLVKNFNTLPLTPKKGKKLVSSIN